MTSGTLAIDLACTTCNAQRDARCTDTSGAPLGFYHVARIEAARARTRESNLLSKKAVRTK